MRAILFDFGGTLDFPQHWLDRFLSHYRAAGIEIERSELDLAFDAATRTAYGAGDKIWDYGLSDMVGYLIGLQFDNLREHGPLTVREHLRSAAADGIIGQLAHRISSGFVTESLGGLERSRNVLVSLAGRFKLGVVSNFYGNLNRVLAGAGFGTIVHALADSGRLGIYKPDVRIFEAALAQLGVAPADAAMVGDSLDKDCAPARRLGMRTVWLRQSELSQREPKTEFVDFTIESLAELENLEWQRA
jgi:FMN phosphatase YigB (HAD superfamily)